MEFKNNGDKFNLEYFLGFLEDKQIIKFYSETSKDLYTRHILTSKVGLIVLKKLVDIQKIEVETLSQEMKNLFLIYFGGDSLVPFGYSKLHEQALKNYLSVLHLKAKLDQKLNIESTVKKMMSNAAGIKDIVLEKHSKGML